MAPAQTQWVGLIHAAYVQFLHGKVAERWCDGVCQLMPAHLLPQKSAGIGPACWQKQNAQVCLKMVAVQGLNLILLLYQQLLWLMYLQREGLQSMAWSECLTLMVDERTRHAYRSNLIDTEQRFSWKACSALQ